MRTMRTSLLAVGTALLGFAAGLVVSAGQSRSGGSLPTTAVSDSADADIQTLVELQHRIAAALAPLDSVALDTLLADDMQAINAGDQVLDKAASLHILRAAAGSLVGVVDDSIRVRRFGPVAVMTLRETIRARTDRGEVSGRLRMTEVWLKRGGRWRAVASQATAIP